MDKLLTLKEVAEYLRVSPATVRQWIREGRLRAVQLSRRGGYRVRPEDLEAFLRERLTRPDALPGRGPALTAAGG